MSETVISELEREWILQRRITRSTDNYEVQIYPMGAERFLSSRLKNEQSRYYPIQKEIIGKDILLIPAHGNSSFLFAQAGARSIHAYDKDPVTIAWMKVFKKYYHFRATHLLPSIGELFEALTRWYPPRLPLPRGNLLNYLNNWLSPNTLRRTYVHYLVHLAQTALQNQSSINFELEADINFHTGSIAEVMQSKRQFDTVFIPYLLGVKNGVEQEREISEFIDTMITCAPRGAVIVTPSQTTRDFYFFGKRYLETLQGRNLSELPAVKKFLSINDSHWFRSQGLAIFSKRD